jgi:hypothetical protein
MVKAAPQLRGVGQELVGRRCSATSVGSSTMLSSWFSHLAARVSLRAATLQLRRCSSSTKTDCSLVPSSPDPLWDRGADGGGDRASSARCAGRWDFRALAGQPLFAIGLLRALMQMRAAPSPRSSWRMARTQK